MPNVMKSSQLSLFNKVNLHFYINICYQDNIIQKQVLTKRIYYKSHLGYVIRNADAAQHGAIAANFVTDSDFLTEIFFSFTHFCGRFLKAPFEEFCSSFSFSSLQFIYEFYYLLILYKSFHFIPFFCFKYKLGKSIILI